MTYDHQPFPSTETKRLHPHRGLLDQLHPQTAA